MPEENQQQRLDELNKTCHACIEARLKNFESFNYLDCQLCPIGKDVHMLDNVEWDKVDWNSSQFAPLYWH